MELANGGDGIQPLQVAGELYGITPLPVEIVLLLLTMWMVITIMLILVERGYGTQAMTELGQSALNINDLGSCDNPTTGLALGRYTGVLQPTVAMSTAFLGVLQSDDASCVGMVSNISKIHYNFRKWTGLLP